MSIIPGFLLKGQVSELVRESLYNLRNTPHVPAPVLLVALSLLYVAKLCVIDHNLRVLIDTILPQLVQDAAPLFILCLGGGLVIATGQIDLSSAGVAALAGVVFVSLTTRGLNPGISFGAALCAGILVGALNGWLVAHLQAPSLIVTWAIGLCLTVVNVLVGRDAGSVTGISLNNTAYFRVGDPAFNAFLSVSLFAAILLLGSRLSQEARAVGADARGASCIGLTARSVKWRVFIAGGALAALAGVMISISVDSAQTSLQSRSLIIVSICVLGGTLLSGGYFSSFAIAAATLLWTRLSQVVPKLELPGLNSMAGELTDIIFSTIVLAAVLVFSRQLRGDLHSVLVYDIDARK